MLLGLNLYLLRRGRLWVNLKLILQCHNQYILNRKMVGRKNIVRIRVVRRKRLRQRMMMVIMMNRRMMSLTVVFSIVNKKLRKLKKHKVMTSSWTLCFKSQKLEKKQFQWLVATNSIFKSTPLFKNISKSLIKIKNELRNEKKIKKMKATKKWLKNMFPLLNQLTNQLLQKIITLDLS